MSVHPNQAPAGFRAPRHPVPARAVAVAALTTLLLVASTIQPPPARALSQYCGSTAVAVGVDYASGLDNGHPKPFVSPFSSDGQQTTVLDGWGGLDAVRDAKIAVLVTERVKDAIEYPEKFFEALSYDAPKLAIVGLTVAAAVAQIAVTTAKITLSEIEHQNALVDACSGTLTADLTDVVLVALMEEELANLDPNAPSSDGTAPASGIRLAPTALFLLPDDGMPAWQRDTTRYDDGHPGHADIELYHQEGFIDAEYIGIATLVRNQIAHLEAHGIPTGGGRVYNPVKRRFETVPGARDMWAGAMAELRTGDLRAAYAQFARAYQTAVTAPSQS